MPRNPDLPSPGPVTISKRFLLQQLVALDNSAGARERVLSLESSFRSRIATHVSALPRTCSEFAKFYTSPFVLMFYAKQRGYHFVSEIEQDILPAKLFSSMETSAGRMVQTVSLPVYGWESVESTMHSVNSVLDGRRFGSDVLELATLKSGPRCLNDEMSKDIADDIVGHSESWAREADVDHVEFTYASLYGTPRQSNKKDWHILRNIVEKVGTQSVLESPNRRWKCAFRVNSVRVDVQIKIGIDWWTHLGGQTGLQEILVALIRACVSPTTQPQAQTQYTMADLAGIVSTAGVPEDFNVSLLQRSQLEWLFFLARHYCDRLVA